MQGGSRNGCNFIKTALLSYITLVFDFVRMTTDCL